MCNIASTAVIYPSVQLGENVTIEDYCVLGLPSEDEKNAKQLVIGSNTHLRSHTVVYSGSTIGDDVTTGHHVTIRSNSILDTGVSIGSYSSVDEEVFIGTYSRIHGYSQIGRGSRIGRYCWIYSLVTLMNDPLPPSHLCSPVIIEDMVTVAVNAQLHPGITLHSGCFVSSGSLVDMDVPSGMVVSGQPAELTGKVKYLAHLKSGISHPWTSHFMDYYPKSTHETIASLSKSIFGK